MRLDPPPLSQNQPGGCVGLSQYTKEVTAHKGVDDVCLTGRGRRPPALGPAQQAAVHGGRRQRLAGQAPASSSKRVFDSRFFLRSLNGGIVGIVFLRWFDCLREISFARFFPIVFVFIHDNKFLEKKDVVLEIYLKLNLSQEGEKKRRHVLPSLGKSPSLG